VIADEIACAEVIGTINTTLRVVNDSVNMEYNSGPVWVHFRPRDIQPEPGNVIYDLTSSSQGVHWVASGTIDGCPAEGEGTAIFPGVEFTGLQPAEGYLVVVGPGDNHSSIIHAAPVGAVVTVTCPGPNIYERAFQAGVLLNILGWPNSENGRRYQGSCNFYFADHTYTFNWDLYQTGSPRSADEPTEPRVAPGGVTPECFDTTPCPPICPRDQAHLSRNRNRFPLD
jgi:hypothetical protein